MPTINLTMASTIADLITAMQGTTIAPGPGPIAGKPPVTGINADLRKPDGSLYADFMYAVNELAPFQDPGTIYMPLTGHNLSIPHAEIGEGIIGYYLRTSKQTGGDPSAAGGLITYQQGYAGQPWQVIVDSYGVRNPAVAHPAGWVDPYAPQQSQPAPQGGGNGGTGPIAWGSLNDQDKAYAIATFNRRPGTNVPVAIFAAFNGAGDWSNWKEANEPLVSSIDLAAYAGPLKGLL